MSSTTITLIDHLRVGGEIEASEFQNAGMSVDNDNDLLPENLPRTFNSNTDNECTYQDWGHNGVCHRKNAVNNNTLPQLKVTKPTDFNNRLQLFELLFITNYMNETILVNINKNMSGERVTYGEFLKWLGLWFLISTVIGPSRESFFSNQTCNEFSEAPFWVSQYMTRRRFDKILHSIRYSKKDTPPPLFEVGVISPGTLSLVYILRV